MKGTKNFNRFFQLLLVSFLLAIISCGCVSKSAARKQRNTAYLAGQNAGMTQALQAQAGSVTVVGNVKNRVLIWTRDLTIATAFLQAEYQGITDPRAFVVRHGADHIRFTAKQLLDGTDLPLEPGDILEIQ